MEIYAGISSFISGLFPGSAPVQTPAPSPDFQLIWITDTQYLSRSHPEKFTSLTTWIASTAMNTSKVKMVIHTGDIVDIWNARDEWKNANAAMEILAQHHIPYTWDAGNHDCDHAECSPEHYIGDQYPAFDPAAVSNRESQNWLGSYDNGTSTAVSFTANNVEFVIVNIEFEGDDAVIEWANTILSAHPHAYGIVATHAFLSDGGGYANDQTNPFADHLKNAILAKKPNVFLILNGHFHSTQGFSTSESFGNHTVHELMFDRQNEEHQLGADAVTILNFTMETDHADIQARTIDLNTGGLLTTWSFTTPLPGS